MAGLYFEEFSVGQKVTTVGRTISEADIFNFAGLTGDFNQIHTDAAFASKTQFGQRIAHGLLGLSIATGLIMRTGCWKEPCLPSARSTSGNSSNRFSSVIRSPPSWK